MLAVTVHVHVKRGSEEAFKVASKENAQNSREEAGIEHFEVLQSRQDPQKFLLIEVFKDDTQAPAAHKETAHYKKWRDIVEPMMDRPREAVKYESVGPR